MAAPRLRSPTWRDWIAALVLVVLTTALDLRFTTPGVSGAFFFALVGVVWGGLQALWHLSSTAVSWALKIALEGLRWGIVRLGKELVSGLAKSAIYIARSFGTFARFLGNGFRKLIDVVGSAVDWLRGTLEQIFGPVLEWIDRVRDYVRRIYDRFVRPVLDAIEVARRMFRVLGYLGVDWARAIDRALGRLEQLITYPFEWVTAKLNELTNWINRIVDVNGLLQRVTLLRSLIRDVAYTNRLFYNAQFRGIGDAEVNAHQDTIALPRYEDMERDYVRAVEQDDGPIAAWAREFWQNWELEKGMPLGAERQHDDDEEDIR